MNAWLVLIRSTLDDVPTRLFATQAEANRFARCLTFQDCLGWALDVLDQEISSVVSIGLIEYRDGSPQQYQMLIDFTED